MDGVTFLQIAVALFLVIVGAYLNHWLVRKPRLIAYQGHVSDFAFPMPENKTVDIYTHSIVVKNVGGKVANNVRLGHHANFKAENFQIRPQVDFSINETKNDVREIILPCLLPREEVTVSYLYLDAFTIEQIYVYIKSDEVLARSVTVLPTQQYPAWYMNVLRILLLVGLCTVLYALWKGIALLLQQA